MIASPSARAVASTAAATIAGRAARRPTVRRARQRLTPSAAAPSVQLRGTERSASVTIATMIGEIITVRTKTPTIRPVPSSWITYWTDSFSAPGDQVVADEGDDHEQRDQAVDHRGDRGEQADHRLQQGGQPSRGEFDDEHRREQRERGRQQHRPAGDQGGGVEQRPGVQGVDVIVRVGRRVEDVGQLLVDAAAAAEPGQPVVGEGRPRLGEDEDDHEGDQQQHRCRERAEQKLGALVGAVRGLPAGGRAAQSH